MTAAKPAKPTPDEQKTLNEDLFLAVAANDAAEVARLLAAGANPSAKKKGSTALMASIRASRAEAFAAFVPFLSKKHAGARDQREWTPLMLAASDGLSSMVEALLPHSDPAATDMHSFCAMHHAAHSGDIPTAKLLLSLLTPATAGVHGITPLMSAASKGHLEMVKLLIPHSNPKARDAEGCDALMNAGRAGHMPALMELLPHADLAAREASGMTAFELLDCMGRDEEAAAVKAWAAANPARGPAQKP